jgi:sec-independent protein translocase protein TatC
MSPRRPSNPEGVMSLAEHFRELRRRLIWAVAGWLVASIAGWFLYDPVIAFIAEPLGTITGAHPQLNFQTISAAFDLKLKVAAWLGLILSSPWWIFQVAAFIGPGLKKGERAHALGFGLIGAVLFGGGAVAGVVVAPRAVNVLVSFVPDDAAALLAANSYVSFYMYLVIAFGVSFLIPELLVAANFLGLVQSRTLFRGWRVATLLAFLLAAVINPLPSPAPMIIQALFMVGLYLLAALIARWHEKRKAKREGGDPGSSRTGSGTSDDKE